MSKKILISEQTAISLQNFSYLCTIKQSNEIMENNMTTIAADPTVPYPMTSYEDVTRTCSLPPCLCSCSLLVIILLSQIKLAFSI